MTAMTLFEIAGIKLAPPDLAGATLLLIDYQNTYLDGPLKLTGADEAVLRAEELLSAARKAGTCIIHVAHKGAPGGLFDRTAERGAIIAPLAPVAGEALVEKSRPNAFRETNLGRLVGDASQKLIIAGFMTHNCVSSTARAAFDLGHEITIAADACATRDLPGTDRTYAAAEVHGAALAGLGDHHAHIASVASLISSSA